MKRGVILSLISLLTAISSFSTITYPQQINDSLVVITTEQLKQTNLIFLEHQKLSLENKELNNKINIQNDIISNYQQIDSLRVIENQQLQNTINDLQKDIKKKSRSSWVKGALIGGVVGVSLTSILFLICK